MVFQPDEESEEENTEENANENLETNATKNLEDNATKNEVNSETIAAPVIQDTTPTEGKNKEPASEATERSNKDETVSDTMEVD